MTCDELFLPLQDNPVEEDRVLIDKVLGSRMRKIDRDVSRVIEID